MGHRAERRRSATAAGSPDRLRRGAAPLGTSDHLRHHPALLLIPDGRLRSRRWPVVAAAAVGPILVVAAGTLVAGPPDESPIDNPLALGRVAGRTAEVASWVGVALFVFSMVAALVSVVLRFRDARGVQRQQLRWIAAGATATIGTMVAIVPVILSRIAPALPVVLSSLASLCMPIAVAVAILRYRLYDLVAPGMMAPSHAWAGQLPECGRGT